VTVSVPALPIGKKLIAILPLWSIIGFVVLLKRVDTVFISVPPEFIVSISRCIIPGSMSHFSTLIERGHASGLLLSSLRLICSLGNADALIFIFPHSIIYQAALFEGKE
jgi:hypothetical protein